MKINDSSGTGVSGLSRAQEQTASTPTSSSRASSTGRNDQVSLSSLSSALSAQQSNSPQHAARLAQLSSAVASGSYQIDSQALSSKIISSSQR
jgi:flagellar biosynthesis anti-sigma factor FlgM